MARNAPNPSEKFLYFFMIVLGISILYIDINTLKFAGIKNNLNAFKISSSFVLKKISVDPLKKLSQILKSKADLSLENDLLREELNKSYLNNYLITKENSFFIDHSSIQNILATNELNQSFHYAKLKNIDPNMFNCCDKHRLFIEINNNKHHDMFEAVVFNSQGILGHIIEGKGFSEVILLTDIKSIIPVKNTSGNFYCNAKGGGEAGYIICSFNQLVWTNEHKINDPFYSSGLGGIYPENIKIGNLASINKIDSSKTSLKIKLIADPLNENLFGVIKL